MSIQRIYARLAIDFNVERGTADEVIAAVDRILKENLPRPILNAELGRVDVGPLHADEGDGCTILIADPAAGGTDQVLRVQVTSETNGVLAEARGLDGRPLGSMFLDYYGNKLQVCAYENDDEEPAAVTTVCDDVDAALTKPPPPEG